MCKFTLMYGVLLNIEQKMNGYKPPQTSTPQSPTPTTPLKPTHTLKKWPELKPGSFVRELVGEVLEDPVIREVNTKNGPTTITNFKMTDGVVTIRVGAWDELGLAAKRFNVGDLITVTAVSVKDPYDGVTQVSTTRRSTIE